MDTKVLNRRKIGIYEGRIFPIMPNYYNLRSHNGYKIDIKPENIFRRIYDWGYFSGNVINLKITFTPIDKHIAKKNSLKKIKVLEHHPDVVDGLQFKYIWDIAETGNGHGILNLKGHPINGVGQFSVFIIEKDGKIYNGGCLMTSDIMHKDRIRYERFILLKGAFFSLVVGLLLWLFGLGKIIENWILSR